MTDPYPHRLHAQQLAAIEKAFSAGAADASRALARWIGRPCTVETDSLEQMPLEEATGVLSAGDEPLCFCATEIEGPLRGEMMLAFDDVSGWALSDLVQGEQPGTATEWTEMATSAALETTNILCCTFLNSLIRHLSAGDSESLLPTPPMFRRDFAESLLQFALMGQAVASDHILLAHTRFEIDDVPVRWTLLFVPDAESLERLPSMLSDADSG